MYLHNLEQIEHGENVTLVGNSKRGKLISITVKKVDLDKWVNGTLIQNAFPYLSKEDREFLISGLDSQEWDDLIIKPKENFS